MFSCQILYKNYILLITNIFLMRKNDAPKPKDAADDDSQMLQQQQPHQMMQMAQQQFYEQAQYYQQPYNEYQEPQPQQYYQQNYIYEQTINRVASEPKKLTNKQFQMQQLVQRIYAETKQINQKILIGFNWTLLFYSECRFTKEKCYEVFFSNYAVKWLKDAIGYVKDAKGGDDGVVGVGFCGVCCQPFVQLYANVCGHMFCTWCWSAHLKQSLTRSSLNPFPKCMQQKCRTKASFNLIEHMKKLNPKLKQKHTQVLCRSYATYSKQVKICKGRKNFDCKRCFVIQKMFAVIECQNCGNLVCPRCGQRFHGPSDCKLVNKWNQQSETTAGLIQYFQYQMCPYCKEGVERIAGCNQMDCRCKNKFCYICGEKWLPNHPDGVNGVDYCPNIKEVAKKYKLRRMLKRKNVIRFDFKIEGKKQSLGTLQFMFEQIETFRQKINTQIIKLFLDKYVFRMNQLRPLQEYCNFCKKVICIVWGETLSQYFIANSRSSFFCERLTTQLRAIYKFLLEFVLKVYNFMIGNYDNVPITTISKKQLKELQSWENNFHEEYMIRLKKLDSTKHTITNLAKQEFDIEIAQ